MKRIASVFMACMLAAAPCTTVFAEETAAEENAAEEMTESAGTAIPMEDVGITVTLPARFAGGLNGVFLPYPMGLMGEGVCGADFYYVAMNKDEFNEKQSDTDLSEEEKQAVRDAVFPFVEVLALENKKTPADLIGSIVDDNVGEDAFNEIGKSENYTFYYLDYDSADFLSRIDPAFAEEFPSVHDDLIEALENAELADPFVPGVDRVGTTVSFETTDAEGNTVKSEDIFAAHELTMLNIWETTCGACVGEMPGLVEMNHEYADKGFAVVGICVDADTKTEDFHRVIEENDMDYLNLLPFEGVSDMFPITGFPTSYFVDKNGTIVTVPFIGAPVEMDSYKVIIDKLLAGETVQAEDVEEGSSVHSNDAGAYRVHVTDIDGNPVEGVMAQFCTDTTCNMAKTDADGYAVFEAEEGSYTVHILKVPEGYEGTQEEFKTDESFSDICVVLQKAE